MVTLYLQLPQVCPYQELSYTITFRRVDVPGLPPIVSGPRIVEPYSDQLSAPVVLYISRGLVNNARYSATVNVGTSAGMTTSSSEEHSFGECNLPFSSTHS